MLENAMVTISLSDLDNLRYDSKQFDKLRRNISNCYEFKESNNECWTVHLKVNVDMLIQETKDYACFGEDIELDYANIIIEKESEKNEK